VAEQDGRLGGVRVRIVERDDRGDPRRATEIADRLLAEGVGFVTGLTTSPSAVALHRKLQGKPVVLLSSGAGPRALPGKRCLVSVAPPEDAVHENAGAIAQARRYRTLHVVTSRTDAEAALRRRYTGQLSASDARSALREIRRRAPDAVYAALPPKALLAFLRSYQGEGLFHRIPVIAADVEPQLLDELGPDFAGLIVSVPWAASMEPNSSARFVEAFRARYGRTPSSRARQGYEAALLLGAAFEKTGGAAPSPRAVAKALAGLEVAPADWHAWEVFNEASGRPYLVARERTLEAYIAPSCAGN
jgi:branched-chain amino acid transport system substrate-binding protein